MYWHNPRPRTITPGLNRSKLHNLAAPSDLVPGRTLRVYSTRKGQEFRDYIVRSRVMPYSRHPQYQRRLRSLGEFNVVELEPLHGGEAELWDLMGLGIEPLGPGLNGQPRYRQHVATCLLITCHWI